MCGGLSPLIVLQPPQLKNSASHGAHTLQARGVKLALGTTLYDPGDPMGKMFFNVLATFAEFEGDLIRLRTREGMAIARAKGKYAIAGEAAKTIR